MLMEGRTLFLQTIEPCTCAARMRRLITAGRFEASERPKPSSTMRARFCRFGRGSIRQSDDLSAKAWVRSWITLAPAP